LVTCFARKPFKGSKDADFCLVSEKNLSQNNGPMGWSPGPGVKVAKKLKKHPHLRRSFQQTPTKNKKFFFRCHLEDLLNPEGLKSSLALAAGHLWPKKGEPIYWLERSLKG